jgi:hypothetical protein
MTHSVYVCDNFEVDFVDNILTIWNAKEIAKVSGINTFNKVTQMVDYDSIVCPGLYLRDYKDINIILFK